MCPQERRFGPSNRRDVMNEGISRRNFIGGAALGGAALALGALAGLSLIHISEPTRH